MLVSSFKERSMIPEECVLWPLLERGYISTLRPWKLTSLLNAWCKMLVKVREPRLNVMVYLLGILRPNGHLMLPCLCPSINQVWVLPPPGPSYRTSNLPQSPRFFTYPLQPSWAAFSARPLHSIALWDELFPPLR